MKSTEGNFKQKLNDLRNVISSNGNGYRGCPKFFDPRGWGKAS